MEPEPPKFRKSVVNGKEWNWSQWDRIDLTNPKMTLKDLLAHVEDNYHANLSMLSAGVTILFSDFMNRAKREERMKMTLSAVYEAVTKKPIPPAQKYMIFEMLVTDIETDDEIELPYIRFK